MHISTATSVGLVDSYFTNFCCYRYVIHCVPPLIRV